MDLFGIKSRLKNKVAEAKLLRDLTVSANENLYAVNPPDLLAFDTEKFPAVKVFADYFIGAAPKPISMSALIKEIARIEHHQRGGHVKNFSQDEELIAAAWTGSREHTDQMLGVLKKYATANGKSSEAIDLQFGFEEQAWLAGLNRSLSSSTGK